MAKRKAAPKDDAAATSPSGAGAQPPDGSVYIGQSIKPESTRNSSGSGSPTATG